MEKVKLNIQLAIAVIVFLVGCGLVIAGFILPPPGVIHDSVLIVFGEACTFSGSLIGIDYRYTLFRSTASVHCMRLSLKS